MPPFEGYYVGLKRGELKDKVAIWDKAQIPEYEQW